MKILIGKRNHETSEQNRLLFHYAIQFKFVCREVVTFIQNLWDIPEKLKCMIVLTKAYKTHQGAKLLFNY